MMLLQKMLRKESQNGTIKVGRGEEIKINAISCCAILYQERLLLETLLEMVTLKNRETW